MKNKRYTIADMAEMIAKQEKKFATNPRALKKLAQAKQMLMQTNDAKRSNSGGDKFAFGGDTTSGLSNYLNNEKPKSLFDNSKYNFVKEYLDRINAAKQIPVNTEAYKFNPEIPEEAYVDDIPFNTKEIAEGVPGFNEKLASNSKTKVGRLLSKNPNLATGIFQGAAMLGDFANQMSAINSMEEPSKVALAPQARLNKNMDTSAYRNDANRAFRTQNMIANNAPNQSVANAMRGNIMGQHLNSLGQVNTAANNYRSQMENQEAGLNASINMQNAGIMNDFYSAKNQFANNKRMAKANAFSGLMGNAQLMTKDYRQQAFDKKKYGLLASAYGNNQSNAYMDKLQQDFFGR